MPLKDDEKESRGLAEDLLQEVMNAADMMGGGMGNVPKLEGFIKGIGALESRFSRLVDVMDDFYSRMEKMNKGEFGTGGEAGYTASIKRGDLFRAGKDEQLRVLEYMKQNQGKQGYDVAGRRVEVGARGIAKELGYHEDDIKAMQRMADRGKFGDEYKLAFGALRDANLLKQAIRQNVEIIPVGQKQAGNVGATVEKVVNSMIQEVGNAVKGVGATVAPKIQIGQQTPILDIGNIHPQSGVTPHIPSGGAGYGGGGVGAGGGAGVGAGGGGAGGGGGMHGGEFDLARFMQFASPFSPLSLAWSVMFGMSGQLFPAFHGLAEPSMMGGEQLKQGVRGTTGFGASFTGLPALGKLFNQIANTDAFELYESMHSSFTVLKNVYQSQEKAAGTIQQSIQLARQTPLEVTDLLKIFSTFSVNPQLRNVLSNKEQMGQLATGVAGLSFLVPEQGTEGAIFAIREALAGQYRSIRNRFNISPELIASSGGMSMSEMQTKPTNFLAALDAFLKQNLGQQTFNELQMTFSKQVGNIYDALTGGIFRSFRQGGLYEGVTGFAAEVANVTGRMFESDPFTKFFADFGGKITKQFNAATNVLKSVDFEFDAPEAVTKKITKGINLITKDMIYNIAPNIDTVIDAVAPMAKSVGSAVSTVMSKGISEIFGGAIGIGLSSIVNTLEMPIEAILPKSITNSDILRRAKVTQTEFITEHPVETFAAGYIGSRVIQNMAKQVTGPSRGFRALFSDIWEGANPSAIGQGAAGILQRTGLGGVAGSAQKGGAGLASLLSIYNAYRTMSEGFDIPPNLEERAQIKRNRQQRGDTRLSEYYMDAQRDFNEGNPYKNEKFGFFGNLGMTIPLGVAAYSMARKYTSNMNRFVPTPNWVIERAVGQATPIELKYVAAGPPRPFENPNLATSGVTIAGYSTPQGQKKIFGMATPIEPRYVQSGQEQEFVNRGLFIAQPIQKSWFQRKMEQVHDWNVRGQSMPIALSKSNIQELYGPNVNIEETRAALAKNMGISYYTGADRATGQTVFTPRSRLNTGIKQGAVGLGVTAATGLSIAENLLPERELSNKDLSTMRMMKGVGSGMMGLGGLATIFPGGNVPGGIMMGLGFAVNTVTQLGYGRGWFGGDKDNYVKNQEKRMAEANKALNGAVETIINNRIRGVKSLGDIKALEDVMSQSWGTNLNQMITDKVAKGKISSQTGDELKKELVGLAKRARQLGLKENIDNIKDWITQSTFIDPEQLKEIDESSLRSMYTAARAFEAQGSMPFADIAIKAERSQFITQMMKGDKLLRGIPDVERDIRKAEVQGEFSQLSSSYSKLKESLTSFISINQQQRGLSKKEADDYAEGSVDRLGFDKIDKAIAYLKPYAVPKEQYLTDTVYNVKQQIEDIFQPRWIQNISGTQKDYQGLLQDMYQKQLLFHTQPRGDFGFMESITEPKPSMDKWDVRFAQQRMTRAAQQTFESNAFQRSIARPETIEQRMISNRSKAILAEAKGAEGLSKIAYGTGAAIAVGGAALAGTGVGFIPSAAINTLGVGAFAGVGKYYDTKSKMLFESYSKQLINDLVLNRGTEKLLVDMAKTARPLSPKTVTEYMGLDAQMEMLTPVRSMMENIVPPQKKPSKQVQKLKEDYVGVGAFVMDTIAQSFPQILTADIRTEMYDKRVEAFGKSLQENIKGLGDIDKVVAAQKKSFSDLNINVEQIAGPDSGKKIEDLLKKHRSSMLNSITQSWKEAYKNANIEVSPIGPSYKFEAGEKERKQAENKIKMLIEQGKDFESFKEKAKNIEGVSVDVGKYENQFNTVQALQNVQGAMKRLGDIQGISTSGDIQGISTSKEFWDMDAMMMQSAQGLSIGESLKAFIGSYIQAVESGMSGVGRTISAINKLASGDQAGGAAQPYEQVEGKLTPSSFTFGGREIANPWVQRNLRKKRKANMLSPIEINRLNEMAAPGIQQGAEMYSQLLIKAKESAELNRGQANPVIMEQLSDMRTKMGKMGWIPSKEQQIQEQELNIKSFNAEIIAQREGGFKRTMAGEADRVTKFAREYGYNAEFKEGKSPLEEMSGMGGVATQINSLGTAAQNAAEALRNIGPVIEEIISKSATPPDGNNNVQPPM